MKRQRGKILFPILGAYIKFSNAAGGREERRGGGGYGRRHNDAFIRAPQSYRTKKIFLHSNEEFKFDKESSFLGEKASGFALVPTWYGFQKSNSILFCRGTALLKVGRWMEAGALPSYLPQPSHVV